MVSSLIIYVNWLRGALMIKIGIDISPMLLTALEKNIIDIDFVEVNGSHSMEKLHQAQKFRPVIIHDVSTKFWLNYQNAFEETEMLAHCHDLLAASKPEWFSTGIGASAEPQGHTSPYWRGADDSQLQTRQQVHDNILRNAKQLKEWLDIPLLLENYNYHPTNAYEYVCEP